MKNKLTTILAIESSCDETAAAVICDGRQVLSSVIASQIPLHQRYGGVVPEIAARAHVEQIIPVIEQAVHLAFGDGDARILIKENVDALAVTVGPGLTGSLLVGINAARTLAATLNMPLIPVNHILGHIFSNWLGQNENFDPFPCVSLVASGGHTSLILSKSTYDHKIIGQTRDDAAGEAFDKAAQLLNLPYPGGPSISQASEGGNTTTFTLPRGLSKQSTTDFSFSGVKTALLQLVQRLQAEGSDIKKLTPDLASAFQDSIVDSLVTKTIQATNQYDAKTICLAGGVAANTSLRERLKNAARISKRDFAMPDLKYCTDNAAMIGAAAYFSRLENNPYPWYNVGIEKSKVKSQK